MYLVASLLVRGNMNFINNKWYLLLVFTVVMPLNGWLIASGSFQLGIILIAMQTGWLLVNVLPRLQNVENK
jgi:hypothetical protein